MIELFNLLAQATQAAPTTGPTGGGQLTLVGFLKSPMLLVILMIVVLFWMNSRARTKERQRYEAMLSALKRNDRVLTIGGVIGTVVDVREGEVVVKVDETSNTKVRFSRSAIKEVLAEPAATNGEKK